MKILHIHSGNLLYAYLKRKYKIIEEKASFLEKYVESDFYIQVIHKKDFRYCPKKNSTYKLITDSIPVYKESVPHYKIISRLTVNKF